MSVLKHLVSFPQRQSLSRESMLWVESLLVGFVVQGWDHFNCLMLNTFEFSNVLCMAGRPKPYCIFHVESGKAIVEQKLYIFIFS